jgi:CubicO group peptidase (beta-lactamase class C family)
MVYAGVAGSWGAVVLLAGCAAANVASPEPISIPSEAAPVSRRVEVVATPPAFADPERKAKLMAAIPKIDAYLQRTMERDGLVGLAAGIVIDDELAWSRGYGLRDPARKLPVEPDTAFGVGSITKSITASAILLLRDRGQLELDRPAVEYLPALAGLVYPTHDSPAITIRHLLTHTSGLPRMGNFPEYPRTPQAKAAFLAALDGLRLDHPPGVERQYSNLGVQILGPLIAEVAQEDHRSFIRREILEPIGMQGAGWTPQEVGEDRLAMPHDRVDGKPHLRQHWTPGIADAAGGLYGSVEDLAAFAIFNLGAWPAGGSRDAGPLVAATVREMHAFGGLGSFQARRAPPGEPATAKVSTAGLGFGVSATCRHPHVVAHAGKTMGHRASLHMLPRHGVAVILLSNLSSIHSSVLPRDGEAIVDLLADTGALQPRVAQAAAGLAEGTQALAPLFARWNAADYERTFSPDYRDAFTEKETAESFAPWAALVGPCDGASVVEATDVYAGNVELACASANLQLTLRVAPWDGHPVTSLQIRGATGLTPPKAVTDAAQRATKLLAKWDDAGFALLFAPEVKPIGMRDFLAGVREAVGPCELGEARFTEPSGGTFVLTCERGTAAMRVVVDDASRIESFEIREDAAGPCR